MAIGSADLSLRTIKHLPIEELTSYIDSEAASLAAGPPNAALLQLYEYLGLQYEDRQTALFECLLALVLADIGSQFSPYARHDNIAKVQSICRDRGLSYRRLRYLAEHEPKLRSMLGQSA